MKAIKLPRKLKKALKAAHFVKYPKCVYKSKELTIIDAMRKTTKRKRGLYGAKNYIVTSDKLG